jgi:hypothetical protein
MMGGILDNAIQRGGRQAMAMPQPTCIRRLTVPQSRAADAVRPRRRTLWLAGAAWVLCAASVSIRSERVASDALRSFDVVVYGGTPGGIMAATAAAEQGLSVALVEPGQHIGGMVAGGLSYTDVDRQQNLIGGSTLDFFKRLGAHYGEAIGWRFEPHVAEQTFTDMVNAAHVHLFLGEQVSGVRKRGAKIMAMECVPAQIFAGRVFIDSSYEGDLMKAAGVSYTVGREGRAKYGESLAGRQDLLPGAHQFRTDVSAEGIPFAPPRGEVGPHITPQDQVAATGEGDGRFQSYCYRITVTDDPRDRIPFAAPAGYNAAQYELLKRYLASNPAITLKGVLGINRIPNGKGDTNSNGPVSLDYLGGNLEYPDASAERRREIASEHLRWAVGLFYFLQNDPSVPAALQKEARTWGLPKDEFTDTGHLPFQLYVREGRRMLGEYVLTQADLQQNRRKPDSIGVAGYNIDIREVQWLAHAVYRFPRVQQQVFTEGYLSQPVEPWEIPLRALLSREAQASNLLVTVCISASTIAYASFRVEPTYMVAGESAGMAAALCVRTGESLHALNMPQLQQLLLKRGQILSAAQSATLKDDK